MAERFEVRERERVLEKYMKIIKNIQKFVDNIDVKSLGEIDPKDEKLRELFDAMTVTKNDFCKKRKEVKQLVFIYASEDSDGY